MTRTHSASELAERMEVDKELIDSGDDAAEYLNQTTSTVATDGGEVDNSK